VNGRFSAFHGKWAAAGVALAMPVLLLFPRASAGEGSELTLDEAVRMALAKNEQALIARENYAAADARVARARSYFWPALTASGTYTRRPQEVTRTIGGQTVVAQSENALSGVAALNLTLFDSRAVSGMRQVRFERNAERSTTAESKRQLAFEVSQAFLATLGSEQVFEASKRRHEYARQNFDAAKARYDAGLVSVNDVTRAELELATAEMVSTRARGETETAYIELGYLLDDPTVGSRKLVPPVYLIEKAVVDSSAAASFVDEAQKRRLDLDALRWTAEAQRANQKEPVLRLLPSLSALGQYRYTNEAGLSGQTTTWNAGLALSWPIFDGFARNADYGERKALTRIADLNVASALRSVDVEVRNAIVSLSIQRASLDEAKVAQEAARKNATETAALYRQGIASALESADANVRLFEADVALVGQRYGLAVAYLNFEAALGLDPFGKEPVR
jgi:outer membrane protein TolC